MECFLTLILFFGCKSSSSDAAIAQIKVSDIGAEFLCMSSDVADCDELAEGDTAWMFIVKGRCATLTEDSPALATQTRPMLCGISTEPTCATQYFEELVAPAPTFDAGVHCTIAVLDINNDNEPSLGDALCGGDYQYEAQNAPFEIHSSDCTEYTTSLAQSPQVLRIRKLFYRSK